MRPATQERRRAGRTKSEKCSCSLSLVHSGANHVVCSHGLKRERRMWAGVIVYSSMSHPIEKSLLSKLFFFYLIFITAADPHPPVPPYITVLFAVFLRTHE